MPFPSRLAESGSYPRVCKTDSGGGCGKTTYNTPSIVSVVVVPIINAAGKRGVVLVRRAYGETKGKLALPGGFVDGYASDSMRPQYSVQGQGALEVLEETGVTIDSSSLQHLCTVGPTESNTVLVFFEALPVNERSLPPFHPNEEVVERVVTYEFTDLCFSTHSEILRWYFAGKPGSIWEFSDVYRNYRN